VLLVTGPFKVNGVPLRRINARYVIATSTTVDLKGVDEKVLARGRERFDIFCAPCHGRTGAGDGMVVRRGYRRPASYHDDRLRNVPVGHFIDVMANGYGAMPDYADQVGARDRWAIAAYIRALQLSEHAALADVPERERGALR